MPSRDWRFRIKDIVKAINAILKQTNNMSFEEFTANETIVKAVYYDFLIIGEAAINIPLEIQARYPDIPWRIMSNMRNVMAHEYFQINLRIVWNTVENNLPEVLLKFQKVMESEGITE